MRPPRPPNATPLTTGSVQIVTAMVLAGRLDFNPLTDTITGANGEPFKARSLGPAVPVARLPLPS